ncbi:MAG: hypothetical protein LUH50_18085 [Bacteroides intestinalis]|nr:hypothetical protein [Bacteroides intestinalis]
MGFSLMSNYEDVFNVDRTSEHIWSIPANLASDNFYVTEILPSDFKRGYNHLGESYIRGSEDSFKPGWQAYCMRWNFMILLRIRIYVRILYYANLMLLTVLIRIVVQ